MPCSDSVKERPILFSGPMVRALLAGTKTQTRRAVKGERASRGMESGWLLKPYGFLNDRQFAKAACPYGQPGDRLWVRENGWERPERTPKMMREGADTWEPYYFDADGLSHYDSADFKAWGFKRRPSIHMPRAACRITLEVTGVRVERLHDISEEDAQAEGLTEDGCACSRCGGRGFYMEGGDSVDCMEPGCGDGFVDEYRKLWTSINGPGSWDTNPWVWVVEFQRAA